MLKKITFIFLILSLFSICYSQDKKSILRVNSFVGISEYKVGEGDWQILKVGDEIPEEAEIRVNGKDDYLELIFYDDTTVRLFGLTSVYVKELVREDFSKKKNTTIFLFTGKVFSKIKSIKNRIFKLETETAIAAVRGTKFGLSFTPGEGGELVVTEGTVEVFDPANVFKPTLVKEGNVFRLPSSLGETMLEPKIASPELIKQYDSEYVEKPVPEEVQKATEPTKPTIPTPEPEKKPEAPFTFPALPNISGNILNFSLGTENIENASFYSLIFTPELTIGSFSFGLYLPFILSASDIAITETNQKLYNEKDWDFSSLQDSWNDLTSKIAYFQFKNDFLLFRIGSFFDYTLGSGLLVNQYNNNLFFPSERNIGLIFGLNSKIVGFETFIGDIGNFELLGGKVFVRPFGNIPFIGNWNAGISTFIDLKPTTNTNDKVFGYSFDLDLPLLDIGLAKLVLYSGIGTLGYYDAILNKTQLYNGFGMNAGLRGNIFIVIYRAEYKNQFGAFIPGYVDKKYDIERESKYAAFRMLSELPLTNLIYNGFLAETGVEISNMIKAVISYEHLFPFGTDPLGSVNNTLHAEVAISKNLIKKVYGSIYFDWKNIDLNQIENMTFPPAGSILGAEIFYELLFGVYIGIEWKKFFEKVDGTIEERVIYGFKTQILL